MESGSSQAPECTIVELCSTTRALHAALQSELSHVATGPVAYPQQVQARFVRPILLPAAVECGWRHNGRCSQLSIVDQKSGKSFIEGSFSSGDLN